MHYIELILYKTYADLKAEVARGHLGVLWWVIEPILYMGTFYLIFTAIRSQKKEHFVAFLLVALVPWKWFASGVSNGSKSIINGANLMNQVYLPKYIFPCVVMLTNFTKFMIVFLLLLGFLLVYGVHPTLMWLAVPIVIAAQFLMMTALATVLAAATPFFPDIKQVIDNALILIFFLSGIMFDISNVSETIKPFLYLNPMVSLINGYREVLLNDHFPNWLPLVFIFLFSLLAIFIAKAILDRFDRIYPKIVMS